MGKGFYHGAVFLAIDCEVLPINPRFQGAIHGLQEVRAVRLNVETDQVRAQ